ncbi:MAG: hypothetical protein VX259_13555, partial [Pseudomonadota bacterium]|nr:hypothetical protein [Pseudomonadota bacterium]
LKAALSPVNPSINGTSSALVANSFAVVPAVLDGATVVKALSDVTVLDAYGRDFRVDLGSRVVQAEPYKPSVARQVMQMAQTRSAAFAEGPYAGSVAYRFLGNNVPSDMPKAEFVSGYVAGRSGQTQWAIGFNQSYGGDPETMGLAPSRDAFAA